MEEKPVKVLRLPADIKALSEGEIEELFQGFFSDENHGKVPDGADPVGFKATQRLLYTLDAERQNVGRLRHYVAHAGENMKRPDAEARVLFMASSAALDFMVGGDHESALELLELAVNQTALSRAGKLDLDMAFWAAVENRRVQGVRGADLVKPVGKDEPIGITPKPAQDGA